MQHELEALNAQVEAAEAELRRDRVRDEYALMDKKVGGLLLRSRRVRSLMDMGWVAAAYLPTPFSTLFYLPCSRWLTALPLLLPAANAPAA